MERGTISEVARRCQGAKRQDGANCRDATVSVQTALWDSVLVHVWFLDVSCGVLGESLDLGR